MLTTFFQGLSSINKANEVSLASRSGPSLVLTVDGKSSAWLFPHQRHHSQNDFLALAVLQALQILDLIKLNAELFLRHERALLDEPSHMLKPL